MKSQAFCAVAAACIASWSLSAHANPNEHDGFQFRGLAGLGYLTNSDTQADDTMAGVSGGTELYFGGQVLPGLTLGGFFGGQMALSPSISSGGQTVTTGGNTSLLLALLGGYADYYLRPDAGWHVLLDVALASLDVTVDSVENSFRGWGVGAGVGYDWWVAPEWSLGILGKFNYGRETGSGSANNTYSPLLAFSFAFH